MVDHDFIKFPELTNAQMDLHYFDSPHIQIFEDFDARVVKAIDGDTIRVIMDERDFDFPVRFTNIAAPEKKETGGKESQKWLENLLLNEDIEVRVNPSRRVDKWGRLLGYIFLDGLDVGEMSINEGHALPWDLRGEGRIDDFERLILEGEI